MSVVIETTIGDLTVDLYMKERPKACLNFLKLCRIKYYNLCIFYKVERNFIAQTGDPTSTGRGGESVFCHLYGDQAKYFDAELKPRLKHEKLGTLSMVNNGNNMNGSQFFLTLGENLTYLDEVHTVLGEVVEGFETLLKINEAICDPNSRPYQDIRITHTVVLHDPYDDPAGLEIPDASPIPTKEQLESGYIGADEEIDDTKGKNVEEIEEKIKESEAKARATILEMVGDLPDADVKPPENVLFVCKLNPVTTSEDLEIIFSRFGTIVSCEVIKDKKSGESLQYAFIEFEKEEDCENAYFKMDNVLIDDRRIHVDFSQSVSKLTWDNKSAKEKGFPRGQNFVIKGNEKKIDGYDMIFDMDNNDYASSKQDKRKHKARSPVRKEKQYTSIPNRIKENTHRKRYHSDQRYHKDRNFEDNQDYSNKKSKYDLSTYKSDKNGKSRKGNIRHISRSPSPISYKKHASKNSRYHSGSPNKSDSPKTFSFNTSNKKYPRNVRHDSSSSNRSVSPLPNKSSQMRIYSSSSKNSHRKSRKDASSPAQLEKERKRVSSSSRSSSLESPRRRPSKRDSSHTMAKSKSPEPPNYKKRITKHVTLYSRSGSQSPKSSYQNKRTSRPMLSRSSSRELLSNCRKSKSKHSNRRSSSSPESSNRNKSKSKNSSSNQRFSSSPESSNRKKSKSKHSFSNQRLSSSPESIGDRKTCKRPDQSRLKSSGEQHKYEKYQKLETKSKTYSKYSDECSSDRSESRSRNKKHKTSSSKSQHTAKSSKHSHKEHRRRKRSSS